MTSQPDPAGYLLGVDVGNTKTHALVTDLNGQAAGFAEIGPGSYEVLGPEGYADALRTVTAAALSNAGVARSDITGMGFGIAGYDWPSEAPIMEQGIESLGINAPYAYVNDVVIGLIAGAPAGWGVAVDAGTGNNVCGRNREGRTGRITGNGIRFGEFGGAGELVWRAMVEVTYAWSRRGPKTALTQVFMDYAEVADEAGLIEGLAMGRIHLSPSLAREVIATARDGDEVANHVIKWTARELGLNTVGVIRQLDLQHEAFDVVLIGSLFNAGDIYIVPLRQTIHEAAPGARLIRLNAPPVVGAVLLAAEAAKLDPGQIREPLIKSTESYLTQTVEEDLSP